MTSLLKTAALLTVVSTGLVGLSGQSASARPVDFSAFVTSGPVATEVPEPSAIAPLALVGAALILRRRSVQSEDI